jgi:hypothetical protein
MFGGSREDIPGLTGENARNDDFTSGTERPL